MAYFLKNHRQCFIIIYGVKLNQCFIETFYWDPMIDCVRNVDLQWSTIINQNAPIGPYWRIKHNFALSIIRLLKIILEWFSKTYQLLSPSKETLFNDWLSYHWFSLKINHLFLKKNYWCVMLESQLNLEDKLVFKHNLSIFHWYFCAFLLIHCLFMHAQ